MNFARKLEMTALCCLLLGAVGCTSPATSGGNRSGSASNANSGNTTNAAAPVNAVDFMTKAMRAQLDARSYRARMESVYEGQNSTRVVEFVAPDRFHMTSDMDEMIIVGSATYRRMKGGPWQKFPMNAGSMISAFRDPKMVEELSKNTEIKFLGTDVLDGTPTLIYQYTTTNAMGSGMTSTSKAWIGAADNLPRRMEVEAGGDKQQAKTVITYYDYNSDISIEPPI